MFMEHLRMTVKISSSCPYPRGCICGKQQCMCYKTETGHTAFLYCCYACCGPNACGKVREAFSCGFDGAVSQRGNMLKWILSEFFSPTGPIIEQCTSLLWRCCCLSQSFCVVALATAGDQLSVLLTGYIVSLYFQSVFASSILPQSSFFC